MMNATERMQRILTANPPILARIDSILTGEDTSPVPVERENRLVTYTEAARRLGLSRPTVYRLTCAGRLRTVKLCGVSRIVLSSVVDFVNGKENAQ